MTHPRIRARVPSILAARFAVAAPLLLALSTAAFAQQGATGFVFEDANRNGKRDAGEKGVPGVRVSNQQEFATTDKTGRWMLPLLKSSAGDEETVFFVVKPRGWMTPVSAQNLPLFHYVHKPKGSPGAVKKYAGVAPTGPLPASIDFPLHRQKEPTRFQILLFGDTQARNQAELDFMSHDVIEPLADYNAKRPEKERAAFGMTLGDVLFDDLSLYDSHNRIVSLIGLPWYNVLGNHDQNYDAATDEHADETWERVFGPNYYSFDYGPVHFVALDDVIWVGAKEGERGRYHGGLGARQLAWLERDLAAVPDSQLVVLGMHIPISGIEEGERQQLFRLLEKRRFALSLSAHTHFQEHRLLGKEEGWQGKEPHHHVVHATVCGSWWSGPPDERGIPHATMSDGGPNGYSVVTFDGAKYDFRFVPASRPADYQMLVHAPEEVASAQTGSTEVLVNVFAGSDRSTVELRVRPDGADPAKATAWAKLEQVRREDPAYVAAKKLEEGPKPPPGRRLPAPYATPHMWRGTLPPNLPAGTHTVEVRTTDMFGRTCTTERVFRVK